MVVDLLTRGEQNLADRSTGSWCGARLAPARAIFARYHKAYTARYPWACQSRSPNPSLCNERFSIDRGSHTSQSGAILSSTPVILITLVCVLGLGWAGSSTRNALDQSAQRAVRVAELRGTIAHLDELLTMSARMAASSGDRRWIIRYNQAESRLSAAIVEAIALATPEVASELERTTKRSNRRLVQIERTSFAEIAAGRSADARRLLDGPEYADNKLIYAAGMAAFGRDLETFAAVRTANLKSRAWLQTSGLVLASIVFLVAAVLAKRGHARLRVALRQTAAAARHDALTGLANRVKLREHMEQTISNGRRSSNSAAAVLYLDLDGFKRVNDMFGHGVGDEALLIVAARLKGCTRETDLIARIGGDEFAVLQTASQQPMAAESLAARIVTAMQEPLILQHNRVVIGTSIGIALVGETTVTPDELLHDADLALYLAKADGRGTWRFFEAAMDTQVRARRTLEMDLQRAVDDGQFEVFYQPLIKTATEELTGFEALLRWNHPTRGVVSPAEFIPLAEQTGLIKKIGAWVLDQACTDATAWPDYLSVAINLSPVQFQSGDLVPVVEQTLARSGLRAGRLELEITESLLLQDSDGTLDTLHRLRNLGARISMDDFGTGYSSLSYLRRFPFDKVKIDQSFLRNICTEKGNYEIIRAVVGLGKALDIKVLAEGVETVEQLRILQVEGCDELQGYLFSRPKPVEEVSSLIALYSAPALQQVDSICRL